MSSTTTPKTPTPPTLPPGVTKECHIVKRPDFDGYGFNLHSEKVKPGQFIGKVDDNSPAQAAGLKEGDRILEVNSVSIGNETHKQVVARIKAIACEVRLLLIDVDGVALKPKEQTPSPTPSASPLPSPSAATNGNGSHAHYEGTKQEMPGASTNISSISVVSTKRVSNASSIQSGSTMNASDLDVVDRSSPMSPASSIPIASAQNGDNSLSLAKINNNNNNNNNTMSMSPPPPSETVANLNNNGNIYSSSNSNSNTTSRGNTNGHDSVPVQPPSASSPVNTLNRAGGLNLPLTAAEMRAKLASKKKFDPKNESVDLKKKFEIIQKL